jgi:hypothetical protein
MKLSALENKLELVLGVSISLFAFIVYLFTLAPTVSFIDSGELATVAATLGIAHPTGYPLFTIVGFIFSKLPIASTVIYRLNIMAAFFCATSVFFFFKLNLFILKNFISKKTNEPKKSNPFKKYYLYVPAIAGTLTLAFSRTFWSQATSIEVYSLHVLFLSIVLLSFLDAISQTQMMERTNKNEIGKAWLIFAFLLGLSFTNHMTTILLAPALVYIYFAVCGFSKSSWRLAFTLLVPFMLGLSVYLFLPVRGAGFPYMNWGNPIDLEKIFWHISGKQYRVWIFSSTESAAKQFSYFINELPNEFNYVFLIVALLGLWNILTKNRLLFIFSLLLFVGCISYSINYDIHDIDSYFLLAYLTISVWITSGVMWIIEKIEKKDTLKIVSAVLVIVSAIPLFMNYKQNDESKNYLVNDYTKNMFDCIESNGIIISYQWDYFVSASYYYQQIDQYRTDVAVIDKELLRRSWYYKQLNTLHPELMKKSQNETEAFLLELFKFEHDIPYAPEIIEQRYANIIRSFIEKNIDERPIYVTSELEPQYLEGFEKIPTGLCYRLTKPKTIIPIKYYSFKYDRGEKSDKSIDFLNEMYTKAYEVNAVYQMQLKNFDQAIKYIDKAVEINQGDDNIIAKRNYLIKMKENSRTVN